MTKFLKTISISLLLFSSVKCHSQFVNIPDANFRTWLNNNGYASCMSGSMMDTTCSLIVNATKVNCSSANITNLYGIRFFDNLDTLIFNSNLLTAFPALPPALSYLECKYCYFTSLPTLPASLSVLNCEGNFITSLPALPGSLLILDCTQNYLNSLPNLPATLKELYCTGQDSMTTLPALPSGLVKLECIYNQLTTLPTLPTTLTFLHCAENNITSLPLLPASLTDFYCQNNLLTSLPSLPANLHTLTCSSNQLTSLPTLPSSLSLLYCGNNQLTALPTLPQLQILSCSNNFLTSLPVITVGLQNLDFSYNLFSTFPTIPWTVMDLNCSYNFLTSLSGLPSLLNALTCDHNQLTALPVLPTLLGYLNCSNNPLPSLPVLPSTLSTLTCDSIPIPNLPVLPPGLDNLSVKYCQLSVLPDLPDTLSSLNISYTPITCLTHILKIGYLQWTGTNLSCLPNVMQISSSTPAVSALGLCQPSGNCPTFWNISGNVYKDANSNCINNAEDNLKYIPVRLDSSGIFLQEFLTNTNGDYSFRTANGNYTVSVDTTQLPFNVFCPATFTHTSVISTANTYDSLANFGLQCKPGFDLESKSIAPASMLRPGTQRTLYINVGDASRFYGTVCTNGVGGSVQAVLNGPVSYFAAAAGAMSPTTINGDTITWSVTDFSLSNPLTDFNFVALVAISATTNDTICVQLNVFPLSGDNNASNNTLTSCYPVVNSFDPNEKFMSPSGAVDTSQQWFTFTIFFQNTGNAPAQDIYILDTLSNNLDATTFTFLSSSHDVITQLLPGNVLRFNYPDINLPDSTTNEPASHGNVHFKIKRKAGLPVGSTIANKAYIYFDLNPPIATNLVSAVLSLPLSINAVSQHSVTISPNPFSNSLTVQTNKNESAEFILYDFTSRKIVQKNFTNNFTLNTEQLAKGIYFYELRSSDGNNKSVIKTGKVVKQ